MPSQPSAVEFLRYPGLISSRADVGDADVMRTFVSHNDVGLNYLERGEMRVLMATGYRYTLGAGRLAVYWGATPHKVEAYERGTVLHWLALPLGMFLRWAAPRSFTRQLIRGRVFFEPNAHEAIFDLALLGRWHASIRSRDAEVMAIMLLELEARLLRLAHSCPASHHLPRITPRGPGSRAERMLLLVAEHFREALTIQDIAAAVGLRADYAGRLFRKHMGMGLTDYITECRLSHAKAMLVTTDAKVLEVARDSGFGSLSQFHEVFKRLTRGTPQAYRKNLRGGKA